ncbi:MAG: DUF1643 domain-containing protein [Clostridia bacterium]|nr:DUF1643 domain-containing protein [Clostridia bacterium]
MEAALRPCAEYDTAKWLFVPNYYTEYRYILGTRGENPLLCIGINPSTAAPEKLDPTLKSVERIALGNGFDSFVMLNVCAQRATSPDDMDTRFNERLHRENLRAFEWCLAHCAQRTVWAAWGNIIEKRGWLTDCVRDFRAVGTAQGARWVRCGPVSKKGHPHHPLYLRRDEPLIPFDIDEYLRM